MQPHAGKIIAELERLIAEARRCLQAAVSDESKAIWNAYVERLERRKGELARDADVELEART